MGFLCSVRNCFEDILCIIRANKLRMIACAVTCILGVAAGIALYYASRYGWWYYNRYCFAVVLIDGGFKAFLAFFAIYALIYLLLVLCNMFRLTHYLTHIVVFIACFYCGANTFALVDYVALWGVIYIALIAIEEVAAHCIILLLCSCEEPMRRSFCETIRDFKLMAFTLIAALVYKIIAFFIVLKILTALI